MATTDIKEGFLCPICMKDLGTVVQLQGHFEQAHSTEDKAVINQLKGLFGKAKRKLLRQEEDGGSPEHLPAPAEDEVAGSTSLDVAGIDPSMWEPQELGAIRSYTDAFKSVRGARVDRFVVETNKLLIRLDKLIGPDAPTEASKRRAFEKSVVPWAPDSEVNLCTTCGRSFSLTRRRHHCRLCGGIICHNCSQFLSFTFAQQLTNPAFQFSGDENGFHRSNSNSSLNSIMSPEGELHIRTCAECRRLLERRYVQMEQRNTKPAVVLLYDKMKMHLNEAEEVLPNFQEMAESLNAGETTYSLVQAQTLRVKLIKIYETVDMLSKRIATLGLNMENPPPPKVILFQRQIRAYASFFLQHNLLGLQALPSEEELKTLQAARRQEIQRQIAEERQRAMEEERRKLAELRLKEDQAKQTSPEKRSSQTQERRTKPASPEEHKGWKPAEVSSGRADDDPMVQQMNIIRGYIKQAKDAQKWDEVHMLEENLKELQAAYWTQNQS